MKFVVLLLVITGASLVAGQCWERVKLQREQSGTITSPNYPQSYEEFESCRWKIVSDLKDYAIILDVKEISMAFRTRRKMKCSGYMAINYENIDCFASEPFCNVFTSSKRCEDVVKAHPGCRSEKLVEEDGLEIELETYFFPEDEDLRFKIEYNIVDCSERITNPKNIATTPALSRGLDVFRNTTQKSLHNTTSSLAGNGMVSAYVNPASIVVPILLVLVLIAAGLVAWRFMKRNRSKHQATGQENFYENEGKTQAASSAVYQTWNPQVPTGNTVPTNAGKPGIYEYIIEGATYASADETASSTGGYEFADKGYIDLDNKYTMADMVREENEYEISNVTEGEYVYPNDFANPYEMADTNLDSSHSEAADSPYLIPNATATAQNTTTYEIPISRQ